MPQIKTKVKANFKDLYNLHTRLKQLENFSSKAGFWEDVKHPNGKLNSAELANILENGANTPGETGYIPPRPFMKDGTQDSEIVLKTLFIVRFRKFLGLDGRKTSPRDTLHPLGVVVSRWMGNRIRFNTYPPNAQMTVDIKGFNRPLWESGWLSDNVQVKTKRKA